jgi:hypothetical protein
MLAVLSALWAVPRASRVLAVQLRSQAASVVQLAVLAGPSQSPVVLELLETVRAVLSRSKAASRTEVEHREL